MAICPPKKIDSNITGLRYAEERCLGELPAAPIWNPLEPNSYSDFGGQVTTVARNPINPSRSRKKGVVTDLEASGGFNQDITQNNTLDLMQGFLFADARERATTASLVDGQSAVSVDGAANTYEFNNVAAESATVNTAGTGYRVGDLLFYSTGAQRPARFYVLAVGANGAITSVAVDDPGLRAADPGTALAVTGGSGTGAYLDIVWGEAQADFVAGSLVWASGFGVAANNGLKTVQSYTSGALVVLEDVEEEAAPPTAAKVQTVGYTFAADNLSIEMNGGLPRLTNEASVDFDVYGFVPGEWVYLDGFANNGGFARIGYIDPDGEFLEFDKTDWTPVAEAATGVTATLYVGTVIKNESDPGLIKRRTYHIERTLGQDTVGTMSEYLVGAVANEFTLNVAQADKATVDMAFVAIDNEPRSGAEGLKPGTRPTLLGEDAFNTSSDFNRIKMASVDPTNSAPQSLFAFSTDLTLTINNNVSANKAIGILGAFDTTTGTFEVGGSLTAYFASIDAVKAVRNNADITIDFIIVKNNAGLLFDIPLLALGNGRLNVEQDQPVTLPLDTSAAESKFGHTLLVQSFPYLPGSAG